MFETVMMFEIVIEKNVPLPERIRSSSDEFPYSRMEVGDSFAVPVPPDEAYHTGVYAARVRGTVCAWGKKHGAKFTVLLVDQKTKVRIWRVA